jgi:hypothetical protein
VLEIRAATPEANTAAIDPADLVSEKLAKLAFDLSSRYRPLCKREIQPFERGYWRIPCAGWPADVRRDLWLFLTNYIQSGLAGWAVWCRRDEDHGQVRLYCWAHVAKHMYLLLYIGSGRLLKGTPAKWVDAEGEVVIEVTPHERPAAT